MNTPTSQSKYRAVLFDLDGTLTLPTLDFNAIRAEIGIPHSGDLTEMIARLSPSDQQRAWTTIERHEEEAIQQQTPQPGALEVLISCRGAGILCGVVTRNTRRSVSHFIARFGAQFDGITTREDPPIKPHPESVLRLLRLWNIKPSQALVVGDYRHDIEAGRTAGANTCFFQNPDVPFSGEQADHIVHSMDALRRLIFA